ncbi:hypothetical protein [Endozoicomonas sp. SCSIO W0465]|uniref:hypothetical protein n=1 Tax=Endozoicomonas sp. SCSIO W0465 TaxID=2918516 RepID=UPI0020759162|nr:hypothetical protein [Endozoicomonas sp. SCSIO W0465]USE35383.1 hypothetical protein MJO57_25300 [Endozoicomonas sp. SCSIO W0465]
MTLGNIAHCIFRTICFPMAVGFISCLSADQSAMMVSNYSPLFSNNASSPDYYVDQVPTYHTEDKKPKFIFRQNKEINERRISSFIYKTIDDPNKVQNQVAATAIVYGLDSIGLGESVREGLYFIKKNTRYSFGHCGELRLKTNSITAGNCLSDGGSVELNSNYNLNAVQLQFKWSL